VREAAHENLSPLRDVRLVRGQLVVVARLEVEHADLRQEFGVVAVCSPGTRKAESDRLALGAQVSRDVGVDRLPWRIDGSASSARA
jgi:hypothetical protein